MSGYFLGAALTVLAGGIVVALAPAGAERGVRLLCSLCAVVCISLPLLQLLGEGFDSENFKGLLEIPETDSGYYNEIYNSAVLNVGEKNASTELERLILKEFYLDNEDIDVFVDARNISEEKYSYIVYLIIYPSGMSLDPRKAEKYVKNLFDCELEVIYEP